MGCEIEPRADLHGVDLSDADLHGADLHNADLRRANLHGADLHGACLRGACLRDAYLHGACLRDADLRGANMHGADLRGADLRGADLRGADLRGADLRGAAGIIAGATRADGHAFFAVQTAEGYMIKAGCRWFTVPEAHAHWGETRPIGTALGAETVQILENLAALAKIRWNAE